MTELIQSNEIVDKTIGSKTNIVMDATLLTQLMACPRASDFRFNLNLQPISGKSNSLEVGSIVHKFLEVYYSAIINGIKKDDAVGFGLTAAQLYIQGCPHCTDFTPSDSQQKPSCGHKINDYPGVKNTEAESDKDKIGWKWALETCNQYHLFYRNDFWVPLEVEVVKGRIIYEDDEIRILWKAKLDWTADTNQGIYPIDHKTMKQRRDNVSLNNQFIGQTIIMGTNGVFINKIGFQTTLKPEEKFTRALIPYSSKRQLEWMTETLPFYAKLMLMYNESGHWPPNFNGCETKYGKCMFVKVCEGEPDDRERLLKAEFSVGPEWNPTNESE